MELKKPRTIGVFLSASLAAAIAFFATCNVVTNAATRIVAPDARGEAIHANYIIYGLFLGIPLGLVVAWWVARRVEKSLKKPRETK